MLFQSEIEEKERIDAEGARVSGARFGRRNFLHKYPAAIRYNDSLFPNNYMDFMLLREIDVLNKQCDEFEKLLDDRSITELHVKRFIQNNRYYHLPASILRKYDFGHHEAVLFKEFQLGTSFKADYLLAGRASGGWQFVFVEFENPYGYVTVEDGKFGEVIRKGLNQIEDWKTFIEANYGVISVEFEKHTNKELPREFIRFDSSRVHYAVVAGRRSDYSEVTRTYQRRLAQNQDIMLLHYDNLLDNARRLIGEQSY